MEQNPITSVNGVTPLDVDLIFEANGIENVGDVYNLTRQLANLPRSHTLPFNKRESVLEHMARTVYLTDFMHHNNLITPALTSEEHRSVRDYMMYHDVHEIVTGDIPYFVEKALGDQPSKVRDRIMGHFGVNIQLSPELFQLAKMIDAFEFLLTVLEDAHMKDDGFAGKRLSKVAENAGGIIEKYLENSLKYKIDLDAFEAIAEKKV